MNYRVQYSENGKCKELVVEAISPGEAFSKFIKNHPGLRPSRCYLQGRLAGRNYFPLVSISYELPKNAKLAEHVKRPRPEQLTLDL